MQLSNPLRNLPSRYCAPTLPTGNMGFMRNYLGQAWRRTAESVLRRRTECEKGFPSGGGRGGVLSETRRYQCHHDAKWKIQGHKNPRRRGKLTILL